ncbi:erkA [Symbiodinium sp. CCMP2592]|nr:erkA [Symbiodinium sp. CCMP2592]
MLRTRSARSVLGSEPTSFQLPPRYQFQKLLGSGSYGVVASFRDVTRGKEVAVKRVRRVFDNFLMLRRTLREIKLMRHFCHPNLLQLHDVLLVESGGELYISMELMDCDLDRLVRGRGAPLEESVAKRFCAQILLGLLHLHLGHVIHRDLKPANIFVRLKELEVKIGDLGLSRGIAVDFSGEALHPLEEHLTEYVVTRWYRAPEVLLARSKYGPKVDVWSVGCILYEMWTAKALFPGKNSVDQLTKVMGVLGTPTEQDQWWVPKESRSLLSRALAPTARPRGVGPAKMPGIPAETGEDFLHKLLCFDPSRRLSVENALQHPYLGGCTQEAELNMVKVVEPPDVSYDQQFDGLSKGGEASALSRLTQMLRKEANYARVARKSPRSISREPSSARLRYGQKADDVRPSMATLGACNGPGASKIGGTSGSQGRARHVAQKASMSDRRRPSTGGYIATQKARVEAPSSVEPVQPVAADVLELLDHPSAPAASSAATSSINPNNARLQRRATVPAAAIPCAAGLRSRAAWKKAIAAAQTARAVVEGGEASTPRSKGSSERQDSAQKTVCPFSRKDLQRESAVTVEASKLKPKSVPGEAQEARIAEELQQLQDLQDQQERRLTHVLGKSQQLSAGLEAEQRGESTEEAKPRKVKDPKAQVVQECRDAADSPSRGLRAAAAFASDRAAPNLEPSLWDQLLQEAEEAQQGAQGAQKAQEAPKITAAKRRSSPRRKGQQPQQSAQSQRTPRSQSEVDATMPRRRSAVIERRSVCHRSASRDTSRNSLQKASPRSEKAKGPGVRPKTDSQMETLQPVADGEPSRPQLQETPPEQTQTRHLKLGWASSDSPVIEQGGERHAGRIAASAPGPKNDTGPLRPSGAAATDAEKKVQPTPPAAIAECETALSDSPLHRSVCEMPSLRPKPSAQSQRRLSGFSWPRCAIGPVKALQTICLQRRGALLRLKDSLKKVDPEPSLARLSVAREASATLRKQLQSGDRARPEGVEGQSVATTGEVAGGSLNCKEAAEGDAQGSREAPEPELCSSPVQRTAAAWRVEASRLSLALTERRRLNECLKLEVQTLESAFQSLIQLGDHQVADLSCVQERNATLSQEHEQSSLECREHHRDYWQEQAPYQGSDMDDVDGLQLRAAGLHKELSKLEAKLLDARSAADSAAQDALGAARGVLDKSIEAALQSPSEGSPPVMATGKEAYEQAQLPQPAFDEPEGELAAGDAEDATSDLGSFDELPEAAAEEVEEADVGSDGIRDVHGYGTGKEVSADSGASVPGSSPAEQAGKAAICEQAQPATSDKERALDIGNAIKSMSRHIERFERASRTARIAPPPSSPDAAVLSGVATAGSLRQTAAGSDPARILEETVKENRTLQLQIEHCRERLRQRFLQQEIAQHRLKAQLQSARPTQGRHAPTAVPRGIAGTGPKQFA